MTDFQVNTHEEIWKEIPGFPGYEISNYGQVRTYWSPGGNGPYGGNTLNGCPQKIMKFDEGNGYWRIGIKGKKYLVHRLVLEVFNGPCPINHEARHKDGNRKNNFIDNLSWATHAANCADRTIHGTEGIGENHPRSKLTEREVMEIRDLRQDGWKLKDLAKKFNMSIPGIGLITKAVNWKHI